MFYFKSLIIFHLVTQALGGSNLAVKPSSVKVLNINRKAGVANPKVQLNLNTPNKVKLAWNKENRNTTTVTSRLLTSAKQTRPG